MLKRSRVVHVSFSVALPCDATHDQILEWLSCRLGYAGGIDLDNPLEDFDVDAISEPVLTDSNKHLREHVEVTRIDGGSIYTRVTKEMLDDPSDLPPASDQSSALLQAHYNSTRQS
jgi:hypothetical protein